MALHFHRRLCRNMFHLSPMLFERSLSSIATQLQYERLAGNDEGITLFRMNRPETRNALSKQMVLELADAMNSVRQDKTCRVVVLKSDVPGAFCSGADLKERRKMSQAEAQYFVGQATKLIGELEQLPCVVIAAIDGFALGGGLEMALACDMRVAADSADMGLTETKLAIIPGAGGTQRLPRVVGVPKAKELIYAARRISGAVAKEIGLVNDSVAQTSSNDGAFQRSMELAREILPQGPVALRMAKIAISQGIEVGLSSGLALEQACYAQVLPTKDRLEALMAFQEKRKPNYSGE